MRLRPLALAGSLALAGPAFAQSPPAPPAGSPASPAPGGADTIKAILDQELAPVPGAYVYNPRGRRDPFISLQRPPTESAGRKGPRAPGVGGMLIQEIALKGIVKSADGFIAMMQGSDGKSYFVRQGQPVADGVITRIDATTVTFRQEVDDPLATSKTRELKKSLYQEEGRQ
jgi:type IV pilus assembly protein PilP